MSFYSSSSSSFNSISQPKMRQEGFHLPSPSPSSGHPPSPPPGPFDLFLTHSSHHTHQNINNGNHGNGNGNGNMNGGNSNGLPSLSLPDAFSRTNSMDLTDELAMSLMNPASPATSNERSTHTPPASQNQNHGGEQTHMHNIFDISAPHSSHFTSTGAGGHAFSLPHTSHRPDLPPLSQPASLATSHMHGQYDHHTGNYHGHNVQNGFLSGRDTFPTHFNSTIPPLSSQHDLHDPHPPPLSLSGSGTNDLSDPFGPFTPTSACSVPARESESPQPFGGGRRRADSRSAAGGGRSNSRSRSRVRPGTANSQSQSQSQGGGPTRTTKSASRRRDSFTLPPHLSHTHSHSIGLNQSHMGHLHNLPSPPLGGGGSASRPSSIIIPGHNVPGGALSPLGNMGGLGSALSPLGPGPGHLNGSGPGIGQASGWFGVNEFKGVNGVNINGIGNGHAMNGGANPGSAPGGEFSLPTPDSVGHGPFGAFGTSVGSMGISPKDTVASGIGKDEHTMDPASKQAALVNEKRRRRRESHNAVERRRRDNINEKISELATLIPEIMLDPTGGMSSSSAGVNEEKKEKDLDGEGEADISDEKPPNTSSNKSKGAKGDKGEKDGGATAVKANKGMILRKSVEYIRYLQQLVGAQAVRNRALEARLAQAGIDAPTSSEALSGAGMNLQADELSGIFGAEGLHSFDDRMELAGLANGIGIGMPSGGFAAQFGALEPMTEMDMDMDMDVEGRQNAVNGKHGSANGTGSSDASDERDAYEQDRDQEQGSPLSASAVSDASSPQDRRDASSDRSEERSVGASEKEERGRRGRDGKVHMPVQKAATASSLTGRMSRRRSKLVAVKEEGAGMDV